MKIMSDTLVKWCTPGTQIEGTDTTPCQRYTGIDTSILYHLINISDSMDRGMLAGALMGRYGSLIITGHPECPGLEQGT